MAGRLSRLRSYTRTKFRFDLIAGITVALVALPLALGFGETSGAGPASGLVTAIVAGVIAGVLGGSRYQISGPTGAMTVVLVPLIAQFGVSALVPIGVIAGAAIVLMGILRAGNLLEKIPWSVMEGFTLGIAIIIALQQIPLVFDVPRGEGGETLNNAWSSLTYTVSHPLHGVSIAIAVLTVALKMAWPHLMRWLRVSIQIPASAAALVLVSALVVGLGLNVRTIGEIPSSELFQVATTWPTIPLPSLLWAALIVAFLGALESLLSARVGDSMVHRRDHELPVPFNPHRELIGQGIATGAASLMGGMPATGAIARTSVNIRAGARTRVAAVTHSAALLVFVLALSSVVSVIPIAVLGGILLGTSWRIANPRSIMESLRTTWPERAGFVVTALAVVALDLVWGIVIGAVVHALLTRLLPGHSTHA